MNRLKTTLTLILAAAVLAVFTLPASATRIKDIARVDGVRTNQIYGMGLVAGLQGTGDNVRNSPYSAEFVANLMQEFNVQIDPDDMRRLENFAVVMVTADLPAFAKSGDRIDATVSAVGSAESLEGGTLLQTALKGADDKVYGVAQGAVSLGTTVGEEGPGGDDRHTTTGRIPKGVSVAREVPVTMLKSGEGEAPGGGSMFGNDTLRLNLDTPDFSTAASLARAVNNHFGEPIAAATDGSTIGIEVPESRQSRLVEFISELEQIDVDAGQQAKVVINQRTGTVVVGGEVEIQPVSIAQSGISLTIGENGEEDGAGQQDQQGDQQNGQQDGQQDDGNGGDAVNLTAGDGESETSEQYLNRVSTADVVSALNRLGVTPRELVSIFEALDASGALLAELEVI